MGRRHLKKIKVFVLEMKMFKKLVEISSRYATELTVIDNVVLVA
jgi:hypothetical protein